MTKPINWNLIQDAPRDGTKIRGLDFDVNSERSWVRIVFFIDGSWRLDNGRIWTPRFWIQR
jgi:hypothetical protein